MWKKLFQQIFFTITNLKRTKIEIWLFRVNSFTKLKCISILLMALAFVGCSKKSDEYYLEQAKSAAEKNNIQEAVTAYQNLVKEYPESPKVPEALFQLATLYQNRMVKEGNLTDVQSLEKAVEIFRSIYDKYPQSNLSAKALFMSGFIQSNELKQYPEATATFNLFLQKFPNNDLASSAKEELNNMGLTPEQILKKKVSMKN